MRIRHALLLAAIGVGPLVEAQSDFPTKNASVMRIWPSTAPGEPAASGPEIRDATAKDNPMRIISVREPTLTAFPAPKANNSGAAVIVFPGGGYNILAYDYEGIDVAKWLQSIGVNGFVLKYRVPRRPDQPRDAPPLQPLQDAQRAVRIVRSMAKDHGIDPSRIGVLGFSAGGNLAVRTAVGFAAASYPAFDKFDEVSARPDFAILIYPAYLAVKDELRLVPGLIVPAAAPPMFFAHAIDDPFGPENSMVVLAELRKHKIPGELHVYSAGGHGFGIKPGRHTSASWPGHCAAWMRASGFLEPRAN